MATRTDLSNTQIADGYKQLLHVGDSAGVHASTGRGIYDGDGTATDLEIATNHVNVKTKLKIGGVSLDATPSELNAFAGLTATSSELNQLDDVTVGGTNSDDIVDVATAQSLTNKTIDGGTF
jgi:hypothetical protein